MSSSRGTQFRIGFSADFLNDQGSPVFPDIGLSLLAGVPDLAHEFLKDYHSEYVPQQLCNFDVLISLKPRVTANSLGGIKRLCAIGRCGVGYDNVDLNACTNHDIAVFITPTAVVHPVAEAIVLFILAASHNLVLKDRMVRRGKWVESTRHLGVEPRDRVIGSVGLGKIARKAIDLLRPFGPARFLAFDPYVRQDEAQRFNVQLTDLNDVFRYSDYIMVNCALTEETRGLVSETQINLMKPTAIFVNTARGPIVDEAALISALVSRRIRGAALDVFEQEPLPLDSPLLHLDNVILTSHSIAWTQELFRDMGRADCEGALAIRRGEAPANIVNKEVLERRAFRKKLTAYRSAFSAEEA